MTDALNVLAASATITNSANSTAVDLGVGGTLRAILWARIIHSATSNASGSATITYSIEHSSDNSTFYACASGAKDIITTSTTAAAGEVYIPFVTDLRYVRLVSTFSSTTGTPTTTRQADITVTAP